ncbi:MAG: hypothetical protein CMJ95_08535 [Planctomycetes bacterium]|nr:hypothetical protein [Planctomycetota bacterium]
MFYPLILILSIAYLTTPGKVDDPETWRPFDHPAVSKRVFTAYTRPVRLLSVASDVPQRVKQVHFEEGDRIPGKPGEMVVAILLDSSVEKEMLASAKIALEISRNDESRSSLAISRAETAARIAVRDLERVTGLHTKGDASDSDLDRVILAHEDARVSLEMARISKLDAAAAVRAAASEVAVIEARIDKLILRAPAGWRVEQRLSEPGAGVTPGTPLMVFADLSSFEIEIPMAEEELRVLGTTPLGIERVIGRESINGVVEFVGSVPDPSTRRRRVVIRIPAEELNLEPLETGGGIEMQVTLEVPDDSGGVRIPHRFLTRRLEQRLVKTQKGKLYVVTPVRFDDSAWIVLPGDLPGSAVLVEP